MFGLRLASTQGFVISGDLSYGLGVQETVGDFWRYISENLSLHAQGAHIENKAFGDFTRWQFRLDFTNDSELQQLLQTSVGQMSKGFINSPDLANRYSIHLRQSEPKDYEKVAVFQRCLVFDSEFDGMQFPRSRLSRPLQTDPALYR
ncbi:MAG: hypothetical protein KUG79_07575 [Pseudomonadales bacterium]|nr:hypothetical protein [Pseudomonadales bacterium]